MDGWFRGLVALYIHQNRLMWSRVQTLGILQFAAFGGGYRLFTQDQPNVAAARLLVGACAFLTFVLLLIILRDQQVRNVHRPLIQKLGEEVLGHGAFKLDPDPSWWSLKMKGDHWIIVATVALIIVDVAFLWQDP